MTQHFHNSEHSVNINSGRDVGNTVITVSKIAMIKHVRDVTGLGLRESKVITDQFHRELDGAVQNLNRRIDEKATLQNKLQAALTASIESGHISSELYALVEGRPAIGGITLTITPLEF